MSMLKQVRGSPRMERSRATGDQILHTCLVAVEFVPDQQDRGQAPTSQFPQGHRSVPCAFHTPIFVHFYSRLQGRGSIAGGRARIGNIKEGQH